MSSLARDPGLLRARRAVAALGATRQGGRLVAAGGMVARVQGASLAMGQLVDLEPVEVYGVASFYPMFYMRPVGRHTVGVCRNISCDLRGSRELLSRASQVTGAEVGRSSEDGRFYLETLECQGACCDAPMMVIDGQYHENLTPDEVEKILGGLE